ncbi:hypothetical protein D187_003630 [Cystobacter fuscus DSM 2262]|uniref:PIN domain-containing protein n=1 Tax=Cystobacter fuscus (strain ATCC 25194 / DSM 2262 / NBRC 100088 / M29) TaxID=1242864 RepID=S9P366_CYSF2|nr:hypothetical protein [Cystobacter fuscus]EPX58915.1 hypothetical protein D187_003630 [Cystobacter fuscus DSM 2262]
MSQTVLVIDTSILCVWLAIPHLDTCGPDDDRWDKPRVDALIQEHLTEGATLVLPLASIIETGNHIAQNPGDRFVLAQRLCDLLRKAVDGTAPYAAFSEQSVLWEREHMQGLTGGWPPLAARSISLADATIRDVAHFYARRGLDVRMLTGDLGLQALSPPAAPPALVPRRNRSRL